MRRALIAVVLIGVLAPLLPAAPAAAAAPAKPGTILYGASYYWEYMPYERLEKDVALMEKAGISFLRVAESSWGVLEPADGVFDLGWLRRVLDRVHRAGIKVVLGTPTYSIPAWLYKEHPEIQVKLANQPRYSYGLRQMTDMTHPVYRRYAERIIRKLVTEFRDHPAVIGYQLDNESHPSGTADTHVQAAFRERLRRKFGTPENLNKAWGLNYWGQRIASFDDLPPRDGAINPGYKLEWERFEQSIAADFLGWQAGIVRELKRPDQFITHDFVGGFPGDVDAREIAGSLDVPAVNIYMDLQDRMDGEYIAYCGDIARSLKGGNYLVTETTAQTTGWDSRGQFPPYDGQLRLAAYADILSGADLVAYWHWHSLHYGQETYWKGILGHDLEPGRVYDEVSRVAHELRRVGPVLAGLKKTNRVAILYSLDSRLGLEFMPFDATAGYMTVLDQMYRALYRLNVETDFIFPGSRNLADYALILVPPLYVAGDELLARLSDYVKGGGHLLMSFKSGFADENSTVRWTTMPGLLREASGFRYSEFTNLRAPLALRGDPFRAGDANRVSAWAEYLIPEGAEGLAWYDHPVFGRYPAVTRHTWGKGSLTYEGTVLSGALQEKVVAASLAAAGVAAGDSGLPEGVRTKRAVLADGSPVLAFFNFSAKAVTLVWRGPASVEVLSGRALGRAAALTLGPWDVAVVRERSPALGR